MARLARTTILGYPHHVVQRGNYDQPVFASDADYRRYLDWLQEYSARYTIDIWAYCLMPNHVHLICVPRTAGALARNFNTLHMRYAQYFNGKRSVHGHLWRARFMSCVLDNQSVHEEIRFIENNPVRAGLVERAELYPWSSAVAHVSDKPDPVITRNGPITEGAVNWGAFLAEVGNEALIGRVRSNLRTGRPAGDGEFVSRLETLLGRRLEARPRGRPPKERKKQGLQWP